MKSAENKKVVDAANQTVDAIIADVLGTRDRGVVVGEAPAGAGKSYAIGTVVEKALAKKLRVAVATPTNEQAFALVKDLAARDSKRPLTYVPASSIEVPSDVSGPRNVTQAKARDANGSRLVVGTLHKLGDAFARGDLNPFDVLLIDEAFQANSVQYYRVGGLAERHLLMGDRGQLAPFTTAPQGDRWRGLAEDPLLTAIEVIRRNHPELTKVHKLPITRRLDPRGAKLARAFYRGHQFEAAVQPDVRKLEMGVVKRRSALDAILETAASTGWAHVEQPGMALALADQSTIALIVALMSRLLSRNPTVRCERNPKPRTLEQSDVAIAVSHNDQKSLLRVALDEANLKGVVVNTANKLQGLTYEFVVAWHPLAGLDEADEFHLDPGRLCVMLTRHRQACVVVGRSADRALVEGIPPASPAYVGWDPNPVLDGWYVHEAVFAALAGHRIAAP